MVRSTKHPTLTDIARELNVTLTTVSRALNDKPDISPETKQRVIEVARRLGYVQNALGRGLVAGYVKAVGCVLKTTADPFVVRVLEGIEQLAQEQGFAVFIGTSQLDMQRELALLDMFGAYRVAGVVVISSREGQLYLPGHTRLRSPIVLINREVPDSDITSIRIDDAQATRLALTHLLDLGHRRIAHITLPDEIPSSRARRAAYKQILEEHGIQYDPACVVETEESESGGFAAAQHLQAVRPMPTAIFCYNDQTALGALAGLRQSKLRVPDDVSVVGIDDVIMAEWVSPPLTTVRQPAREMGRMAMTMILKLLAGEPLEETNYVVPGNLIVRESTAVPCISSD